MLTRLSVTNFKSWKEIKDMQLAPITGLFGANSSGKTSILQLLLMLKQTVESPDRLQVLIFGGERTPVDLGSFQDVVHRHDVASSLGFELEWKLPEPLEISDPSDAAKVLFSGEELGFRSELSADGRRLAVREMAYAFDRCEFAMGEIAGSPGEYELRAEGRKFSFKRSRGRPWNLPPPVKCYGFPDQVKAYFQNAQFLADLQLAFESMFGRLYYLGPLREYPRRQYLWAGAEPADMGQRGEHVVDALLAARHKGITIPKGKPKGPRVPLEEYVAMWLQKLGLIHKFSVEQIAKDSNLYRVHVRKTPSSSKVLITDVGFGVSQVLPVLVLCFYAPEGSTILLEQPELHLHPSVQSGLADVFIDATRKRNVQIIFESHSEHLLQRLQRRVAEKDIAKDMAKLYFCDIVDGETKLVPLEMDLFGNIANWPKDFFGDRFGEVAAIAEAAAERQAGEQ